MLCCPSTSLCCAAGWLLKEGVPKADSQQLIAHFIDKRGLLQKFFDDLGQYCDSAQQKAAELTSMALDGE